MITEAIKLADICLSISDGDHQAPPKVDSGIPFVTISNITEQNVLDFTDTAFVPLEYYEKLDDKRKPQRNDILYSVVGSFGKAVFIKSDDKFVFQRHIAILRPDAKKVNPAFLYYVMSSKFFYKIADTLALGAAQRTISLTSLRNQRIELPPLPIQNRIAEILSRYDDLIENYQRQISLLEEAAQRLYKEWFVDLHFPGYENTPIVDGVPEGWKKKNLLDVFHYVRGKSYTSKELTADGDLMVNLKNIQAFGGYRWNAEKRFSGTYKEEQTLTQGDLVMGVTDMTQERRLVGQVALIPNFKARATFSMDLIKIIPYELSNVFLYCAMRYGRISEKISPLANGVNVLHLKPDALVNVEMIVPSMELTKRFSSIVQKNIAEVLSLNTQINLLTEARDRLLPKLMNGEIEV